MGQEPDENEDLSKERRIDKRKDIVSVSSDVNESLAEVSCQLAASSSGDEVCCNLVTTVTSHPSLVTPTHVYSQSRPHLNTP